MSEWEDKEYYWVVICRNRHFHEQHQSFWAGYKIFLGATDSYSPLPINQPRITVKCDSCGKEYEYNRKEIMRFESDPVDSFVEHPLFRDGDGPADVVEQQGPVPADVLATKSPSSPGKGFSFLKGLFGRPPGR